MDIFNTKGISPMLIGEQVEAYDDSDSIFEFKIDGIRAINYCDKNSADFRNKRDVKMLQRFPELAETYKNCKEKCILDGELNVLVNGKPDFREVQRRSILTDPFKIELAMSMKPANFVVYDIIYYKGRMVNQLPLLERKDIIERIISENQFMTKSRYIDTYGKALYEVAERERLEGIVGKKKSSLYWFGKKTKEWKKCKVMDDEDLIAIGYFPNKNHMTTLILALYNENDELVVTNHVQLGVSISKLKENGMEISNCPLKHESSKFEDAIWIKPMVCTIEYMVTDHDEMRQASFKTVRDDKLPEECRIGE